jgi:restriction endonuclease S subunit
MKSISKAKEEFNQKVSELAKEVQPALYGHNLKEIVLYEKMLEIQEQINTLAEKMDKK